MTPKGKQFARLCRKWRQRLMLYRWTIRVTEQALENLEHGNGYPALAEVAKHPEYFNATVKIDPAVAKDHDAEALDAAACHEMIHLVLAPLDEAYDKITDGQLSGERAEVAGLWLRSAKEQVTTHLQRVLTEVFAP